MNSCERSVASLANNAAGVFVLEYTLESGYALARLSTTPTVVDAAPVPRAAQLVSLNYAQRSRAPRVPRAAVPAFLPAASVAQEHVPPPRPVFAKQPQVRECLANPVGPEVLYPCYRWYDSRYS